jgi:DNA transformation protein and related proteins
MRSSKASAQQIASSGLKGLRNLGPTIIARLNAIGIHTRSDLERAGAARAYRFMAQQAAPHRLAVCYYLYSLEGALQDRHWDDFTDAEKTALRLATGMNL